MLVDRGRSPRSLLARLPGARSGLRRLRRCRLAVGEYRIYSAYGGSGSSHLCARLGAFERPDVWQPPFRGRRLVEWEELTREPGALLDAAGYDATTHLWEPFQRRTEGVFEEQVDPDASIRDNLVRFCRWIEGTSHRVVFVHAATLGLFSAHEIRHVTFLIRHPLHSLVSFAKPERHGKEIEALGGIGSGQTLELWADRWNRFAAEYLECRRRRLDPVLIRFEFAERDAQASEVHRRIFAGFESSRRSPSPLAPALEDELRARVAERYFELYDRWEV